MQGDGDEKESSDEHHHGSDTNTSSYLLLVLEGIFETANNFATLALRTRCRFRYYFLRSVLLLSTVVLLLLYVVLYVSTYSIFYKVSAAVPYTILV